MLGTECHDPIGSCAMNNPAFGYLRMADGPGEGPYGAAASWSFSGLANDKYIVSVQVIYYSSAGAGDCAEIQVKNSLGSYETIGYLPASTSTKTSRAILLDPSYRLESGPDFRIVCQYNYAAYIHYVALTYQSDTNGPTAPGVGDLSAQDDTGYSNTDNITRVSSGLTFMWSESTDAERGMAGYEWCVDGSMWHWTNTSSVDISSSNGMHTLFIRAIDQAGNISSTSRAEFVVDTQVPVVRITNPSIGDAFWSTSDVCAASGTAADAVGIVSVEAIDSMTAETSTCTGTAAWVSGNMALLRGHNCITVSARDLAGNVGRDAITVFYRDTSVQDFDGDCLSDPAVFYPANGTWYLLFSGGGSTSIQWGFNGSVTVPGDYDGDGKTDLGIFYNVTGHWYVRSVAGKVLAWDFGWGWPGAVPVPGDYDGDGKSDVAVFDGNTGRWFVYSIAKTNVLLWNYGWGWKGATPVCGDYDNDAASDLAVMDKNTGRWFIYSMAKSAVLYWDMNWGWPSAATVPGDFDGDNRGDLAVYDQKTSRWFVYSAARTNVLLWNYGFGFAGAKPIWGDYDGDGKSDMTVYYPGNATWYILGSTNGYVSRKWGFTGAVPTMP